MDSTSWVDGAKREKLLAAEKKKSVKNIDFALPTHLSLRQSEKNWLARSAKF